MAAIYHQLEINASIDKVFECVATPEGIAKWWTLDSSGTPLLHAEIEINFGPEYKWKSVISNYKPQEAIEYQMIVSDNDWKNTKIGFNLQKNGESTRLDFYHIDWPEANDHFKISSYCWAAYLRILKRYLEKGEFVPYQERYTA